MTMSKKLILAALNLTVALGAAAMAPSEAAAKGFFRGGGGGGGKMLAGGQSIAGLAAVRGRTVQREIVRPPVKEIAERRLVRERTGVKELVKKYGEKVVIEDLRRAKAVRRVAEEAVLKTPAPKDIARRVAF